ncbi:unnamed protein product [Lampetra planeri]
MVSKNAHTSPPLRRRGMRLSGTVNALTVVNATGPARRRKVARALVGAVESFSRTMFAVKGGFLGRAGGEAFIGRSFAPDSSDRSHSDMVKGQELGFLQEQLVLGDTVNGALDLGCTAQGQEVTVQGEQRPVTVQVQAGPMDTAQR